MKRLLHPKYQMIGLNTIGTGRSMNQDYLAVLSFPHFETSTTTPPKPDTTVVSCLPWHCFGKVKGVVKSYAAIVGAADAKKNEEGMVRVRASST